MPRIIDSMPMVAVFVLALTVVASTAQKPSAAQLARAGWTAINSGRLVEAASTFDEALKIAPQDPSVLVGAGMVAHLQGRWDAARRYLIDALRADPSMTPASVLL